MTSLLRAAWQEYERDRARYFAGAMVYFALMSVVPILLLLLAAIGWSLRFSSAAAGMEGHVLTIVETNLGEQFRRILETLLTQLQQESLVATLAGLLGLLIHDLRRSAVRNMEQAGVPRSVAMKLTGHKTENVYRRYAIVSDADLDSAAQKLAAAAGR